MNNAICGDTCENQKKWTFIRIVNDGAKAVDLLQKLHRRDFLIFDENLAGNELAEVRTNMDKPFPVGFTVLELSKLRITECNYNVMKAKYGEINSFVIYWHCFLDVYYPIEELYQDMLKIKKYFDLSEYPIDSPFHDKSDEKVVGKMKDEGHADPIVEFVGLRPKI